MYNSSQSLNNGGFLYVNQEKYQNAEVQARLQAHLYKQQMQPSSTSGSIQGMGQGTSPVPRPHHNLHLQPAQVDYRKQHEQEYLVRCMQMQQQQHIHQQSQRQFAQAQLLRAGSTLSGGHSSVGNIRDINGSHSVYVDKTKPARSLPMPSHISQNTMMSGSGLMTAGSPHYPIDILSPKTSHGASETARYYTPRSTSQALDYITPLAAPSFNQKLPKSDPAKVTSTYETPLDLSLSKGTNKNEPKDSSQLPLDLTICNRRNSKEDDVILTHVQYMSKIGDKSIDRGNSSLHISDKHLKHIQDQAFTKQFSQRQTGLSADQRQRQLIRYPPETQRDNHEYRKQFPDLLHSAFLSPNNSSRASHVKTSIHITKTVSNGTATIKAEMPYNIPQTEQENNIVRIENRNQTHLSGSTVLKGDQYHSLPTTHNKSLQQFGNYLYPPTSMEPKYGGGNSLTLKNASYREHLDAYNKKSAETMLAFRGGTSSGLEPGEIPKMRCGDTDQSKTVIAPSNLAGGTMHMLPTGVRLHRTSESIKPFYHDKNQPASLEIDPNRIPVANVNPIVNPNQSAHSKKSGVYDHQQTDTALMLQRSFSTYTSQRSQNGADNYNSQLSLDQCYNNSSSGTKPVQTLTFDNPHKLAEMSDKEKVYNWLTNIPNPIQGVEENLSYTNSLPEALEESSHDIPDGVTHASASCSLPQTDSNWQSSTTGSQLPNADHPVRPEDHDTSKDLDVKHRKYPDKPRIMAPLQRKHKEHFVKLEQVDIKVEDFKGSITDSVINSKTLNYVDSSIKVKVPSCPPSPTTLKLKVEIKKEENIDDLNDCKEPVPKRRNSLKSPRPYKKSKSNLSSLEGKVLDADQTPGKDLSLTIRIKKQPLGNDESTSPLKRKSRGSGVRTILRYNKNAAYERELHNEEKRLNVLRKKRKRHSHSSHEGGENENSSKKQFSLGEYDFTGDSSDTEIDEPVDSLPEQESEHGDGACTGTSRHRRMSGTSRGSRTATATAARQIIRKRRHPVFQQKHFGARKRRHSKYNIKRPSTGLKTTLTVVKQEDDAEGSLNSGEEQKALTINESLALRPMLKASKTKRGRGARTPRGSMTKGARGMRRVMLEKNRPSSTPPANKPHYEHDVVMPGTSDNKPSSVTAPPGYAQLLKFTKSGKTIIHNAVRYRDMEVLQYCLSSNKTPVNSQDSNGLTALHDACVIGDTDIVMLLLRYDADIRATDKLGRRPLHYASMNGHIDVVRMLLAYGDDVTAVTNNGETSLQFAGTDSMSTLLNGVFSDLEGVEDSFLPWSVPPSAVFEEADRKYCWYDALWGVPSDTASVCEEREEIQFEEYEDEPLRMYKLSLPETNVPKNYFLLEDVANDLCITQKEFMRRYPMHYVTKIPMGHFYNMTSYIRIRGVFNAVLQTVDVIEAVSELCELLGGHFDDNSTYPVTVLKDNDCDQSEAIDAIPLTDPFIDRESKTFDQESNEENNNKSTDLASSPVRGRSREDNVQSVPSPVTPRLTRSRSHMSNSSPATSTRQALAAQGKTVMTVRMGDSPSRSRRNIKKSYGSDDSSKVVYKAKSKHGDKNPSSQNCDKGIVMNSTLSICLSKVCDETVEETERLLKSHGAKTECKVDDSYSENNPDIEACDSLDIKCEESLPPLPEASSTSSALLCPTKRFELGIKRCNSYGNNLPPLPPLLSDSDVPTSFSTCSILPKDDVLNQESDAPFQNNFTNDMNKSHSIMQLEAQVPNSPEQRVMSPVETGDVLADLKRYARRRRSDGSSQGSGASGRTPTVVPIPLTTTIKTLAEKINLPGKTRSVDAALTEAPVEPPLPVLEKQDSDELSPVVVLPLEEEDVDNDPEMPALTPASM